MSLPIQRRRGTATNVAAFTGLVGELVIDTTNNRVVVQDGSTAGGFAAAKLSEVATISGGGINGLPIGNVTPSTVAATTLMSYPGALSPQTIPASVTSSFQVLGTGTNSSSSLFGGWNSTGDIGITNFYVSRASAPGSLSAVAVGDGYAFNAYGDDGSTASGVRYMKIGFHADGAVSAGKVPGRMEFYTASSAGALTERVRIDSSGNLQMGGTNTVIDANRNLNLRSYTIATLPTATAGVEIYISDAGGGGGAAVGDGTNFRLLIDNYNANATTTGAITFQTLTDASHQRFTTTLTGNVPITLGTTNAYKGARRRTVSPAALGGFTFTVSGKSLTASQWVDHEYDGSAWQETAFGSL